MNTNQQKVERLVGTAVLAAVVVVVQLIASGIKIGPFTITLSLVPIILGAILYGPLAGGVLGAVFGAVVCASVVTGADIGGFLMFEVNPVVTLTVCLLKSTVAGVVAGLVWQALHNKNKILAVILSAVLCPICNTGILSIAVLTFFHELAFGWAMAEGFANAFAYVLFGMVGLNFLVELAINLALTPAILRVIAAVRKRL